MHRSELVTSPSNPLLKDIRRAVTRHDLTSEGLWVAEGFHLLEEALRTRCDIAAVLVSESAQTKLPPLSTRVIVVPDAVFPSLAATETTQGVIALVRPPRWSLDDLFRGQSMVVVIDSLQDPGNTGAIVRAAEAFGATGVLFLKGSAGPYHPKTLRASMGSLFRVPFLPAVDPAEAVIALRTQRVEVFSAMPWTGAEYLAEDTDFTRRCALVIGNEARGIGPELQAVSRPVAIPTAGVESLNAAVAAAVLLYEVRRQRS